MALQSSLASRGVMACLLKVSTRRSLNILIPRRQLMRWCCAVHGAWASPFFGINLRTERCRKAKKDITFSVAGLITLEELERALFVASIQDWGPGLLQETGTVVGRALLRWVKVEPQDIKLKADVRPDHTVICIDDVERFGGDFKVLFGFIVSLLDEAHLHVVLIADEERALALPGYRDYRERIISRAFDVAPAVEDVFQGVVNGYSNDRVRAAILETKAYALSLFEQKCLTNLRTIRAILDEINAILSGMQWPQGKTASLMKLFSAITFHAMAVSKDPSNAALVNRTFLQSDLGMALVLRERKRGKGKADGKEDEPPGIHTLIQGLKFEADAHTNGPFPLALLLTFEARPTMRIVWRLNSVFLGPRRTQTNLSACSSETTGP